MAKKQVKRWYASKTIWIAVAQAVAGILVAVSSEYPELGGVIITKSILDTIIRYETKQEIK